MSGQDELAIGAVADATGLAVTAIRYYDEIGIIEPSSRIGGKRRFASETVGRISFIRRAQDAGFSLDEIARLLDDRSGGWNQLVTDKLDELSERRARLDEMIAMIEEMARCGCEVVAECPRLDEG